MRVLIFRILEVSTKMDDDELLVLIMFVFLLRTIIWLHMRHRQTIQLPVVYGPDWPGFQTDHSFLFYLSVSYEVNNGQPIPFMCYLFINFFLDY